MGHIGDIEYKHNMQSAHQLKNSPQPPRQATPWDLDNSCVQSNPMRGILALYFSGLGFLARENSK